jgi:predicted MPP superfamily phosphohydrolase
LVVGDWDYGVATAATWNALGALINETSFKDFSHIVFMGDMAYDLEDQAGRVGDVYFEQISQSIARYLPFMTIPGNHETAYNYSNYNNRIRSPLWEETNNHYYSYNTGLIHWIAFDFDFYSMNPELVPSMLKWLAEDLKIANENRDRWPWIIFLNHRPLYCSNLLDADCNDNSNKFSQVETLLYENSVDLYLSGHVHSYERTHPIYRNEVAQFESRSLDTRYEQIVNPQAPIHILEGIGGASKDGKPTKYSPLDFSVVVDFDLGFGVLNCHNRTHLEYVHYRAEDNKIMDKMIIVKDRIAYSHDLIE